MNYLETINSIVLVIGIPSIVVALVLFGRKLQILEDLDGLCKLMKHNIVVIGNYLTRNHNTFNPSELRTMSPYTLTDQGKNLISSIGFDKVMANNKADFFSFIDSEHPKLKYDVENSAIKSIHFLLDKPYMEFLKVFLYNNPSRSMRDLAPTLGVHVRDAYLKEHPEITQ
jgi:hypothetical protein